MAKQPGFWDVEERSEEISADGDPLETLAGAVDFERFRPILERAAGKPRGPKGGRPALDVVPEFKMLVLQGRHGLSLEATEKAVRDRPGWMRFCGLELRDKVPDANTLWDFREAPVKAGELDALSAELERMINAAGFISRSGQMLDSSLIAAPRQRASAGEKAAIKAGQAAGEIWPGEPAKAARKDTDARWTVKFRKAKLRPDGARLREGLVDAANTGSGVWADTAYRSKRNEDWLKANGTASRIHRRKPRSRPMSERTAKANGRKSSIRAKVEHVFAHRKDRMGLRIRTVGMARAKAAAALANMAYNMNRLRWLCSRSAPA